MRTAQQVAWLNLDVCSLDLSDDVSAVIGFDEMRTHLFRLFSIQSNVTWTEGIYLLNLLDEEAAEKLWLLGFHFRSESEIQ